ncbi:MAG: M23 family metallopeptidase [Acidobacteriota bacterium]|nr:M23 family metallopeptidase [Acidobacteriota bacterium]MDH3784921.1 M23 family metallopeptidase [Acidobacteriota bacterium]
MKLPRSPFATACLMLALASRLPVSAGLEIDVGGRVLAPGEPVRVWADSDVPLDHLSGTFLERVIQFTADPRDPARHRWVGWTLVDLDAMAGAQVIEVRGTTTDGDTVIGTHALTIESREFPEERLSVSSKYVEPPADVRDRLDRERGKLRALYLKRDAPIAEGPFVRPVPGEPTSIFGLRRFFNDAPRSPHPGLDLRAAEGTGVIASGDARVVLAQDLYYSGNTVILDHGGGLFTLYAHLSKLQVKEDDAVEAGQRVGLSGSTGRVTGPHLHWGAKIGDVPFDPTALLDPSLFARPD